MKTPRDILFTRHQAAITKLDAIRQQVIQTRFPSGGEVRVSFVLRLWLELVLPCRRIWTGLAAVWLLLVIVNVSQRDGAATVMAESSSSTEMMLTFREQQKLLDEFLAGLALPVDVERPRNFQPKPRTEITKIIVV
jgi:hypothetical protein